LFFDEKIGYAMIVGHSLFLPRSRKEWESMDLTYVCGLTHIYYTQKVVIVPYFWGIKVIITTHEIVTRKSKISEIVTTTHKTRKEN